MEAERTGRDSGRHRYVTPLGDPVMGSPRRNDDRPRVLIVEPDHDLAIAMIEACLAVGLEPKLCLGPDWNAPECPGSREEPCYRTGRVEATLVSVTTPLALKAFPSCAAGRLVVAADERTLREIAGKGPAPDVLLKWPYVPETAAETLFRLVMDEHRVHLWDRIRTSH